MESVPDTPNGFGPVTAVTSALVVLIPAGAHPVTATLSPTTNGASVPDGRPNLIAADAFVTDVV